MANLVSLIDHAILHPTASESDLEQGCSLADELGVATVCVKPYWVATAAGLLTQSKVGVGTVIGFPHGSNRSSVKAAEASQACDDGASELDMVVNVGRVLEGDWNYVQQDIAVVCQVARQREVLLKVIFETDFVTTDEDKVRLCQVCTEIGVDFVKTSTGFGYTRREEGGYAYRGATEHDVQLMAESVGPSVQVKASGGIRSYQDALRMVELGASRLGTSASAEIAREQGTSESSY
jgi:deoxyribose-phosphate aldolase